MVRHAFLLSRPSRRLAQALSSLAALLVLGAGPLTAQSACGLTWESRDVIPGLHGTFARWLRWDPDGPGPLAEQLVAYGRFDVAGDRAVDNLAIYDPATSQWSALGSGTDVVTCAFVRANGRLVVGTVAGLREWDGTAWIPPAAPFFSGVPACLGELPSGELLVGGALQLVAGGPSHALVLWNSVSWQPLVAVQGGTAVSVSSLVRLPNGDFVIGGRFTAVGGVACSNVARFDGVAWHAMGAGIATAVSALGSGANGVLVAQSNGQQTSAYSYRSWDGAVWQPLPAGGPANPRLLAASGGGDVLFAGDTEIQAASPGGWNPVATWTQPSALDSALRLANGDLVVSGNFPAFEGQETGLVAIRRSGAFQPTNAGAGEWLRCLGVAGRDGGFVAEGPLASATPPAGLARFDGTAWSWLAPPAAQATSCLAELADGEVLRGGEAATGSWLESCRNGVATPIALPPQELLLAIEPAAAGGAWITALRPWAVADALVYRWDGSALTVAVPPFDGFPRDLVELPNGDLVFAGGAMIGATRYNLARWDGQQLLPIPGAPDDLLQCVAVAANGDLVVAGNFTTPGVRAARFDGASWHPMNATWEDIVKSIVVLPDGSVVVGASDGVSFPYGKTNVRRWDGTQWHLLGAVHGRADVAWSRTGELGLFGSFWRVSNAVARGFTRLTTSCPAGAQNLGGGCSGSAGPLTTRIEERAWLGGSFRTATGGVAANAVALGVFGASATTLSLPQLLPIGGAVCTLRAQPDVLLLLPIVHGEARAQWTLPSAPSLLGASFVQQTLVLEIAAGSASALVAGDGTQLTVGAF